MSAALQIHSADGVGLKDDRGDILLACGNTVPTDASTGYAEGALFQHLDGAAGTQLYINEGSRTSCDFNPVVLPGVDLSTLTATAAEVNKLDDSLAANLMAAGSGADGMDNYAAGVFRNGSLIVTRILVDFDGLLDGGTAGDIIGEDGVANCHIGQITAAKNGTILGGRITCLQAPAGGSTDVDLYSAAEGTGSNDAAISTLTETQLINHGAWSAGQVDELEAMPAADSYLYLVSQGTGDTAYTAGIFLIELFGLGA
jgi:hypothetical protein